MRHLFLAALTWALAAGPARAAECSPCAANECHLNEGGAKAARDALKARLAEKGFPKRLAIPLADRVPSCEKCLQHNPTPQIVVVDTDGSWDLQAWTETGDRKARRDLKHGRVRAFYIVLMPKACRCCEKRADGLWQSAPRPEERADWEPMLRLNRGVVLPFETPASLEPAPKAKHTAKE